MSNEILLDQLAKTLELARDESTKLVVPMALGATLTKVRSVAQMIRAKVGKLPSDPVAAAAEIMRRAETDPALKNFVYEAMAELRRRDVEAAPPPAPPGFQDRRDVLAELGAQGRKMITGPSGHGKTSVVKQARHERAAEFDGDVYIDCDPFRTDGSLRYAEIYQEVLHQTGVEVTVLGEAALFRQYEAALRQGRFLLIFDNVESVSEAEKLVRDWPLSLVLVTTWDGTGQLATWCPPGPITLGGLDRASARTVLEAAAGKALLDAEPDDTDQLLDQCDRIPAFLQQAGYAVRLRRGGPKPVARLVAELAAGHDPMGLLTRLNLQSLPELVYADLALLSAHPGTFFTRDSAEAMLGGTAPATIDILMRAGLVVDEAEGRLRLLNVVRKRLAPPQLAADAALCRLLDVMTDHAVNADGTVEENRLRPAKLPPEVTWRLPYLTPIEFLDLHAVLLVELVQLARAMRLHGHAIRLCGALEVVLVHFGRHHLIGTAIDGGIESAKDAGDAFATARLYATRAWIETGLGLFDRAEVSLDAAELAARAAGNPRLDSSLCEYRSRLARERARYAIDEGERETPQLFADAIMLIERALVIDRAHAVWSREQGIRDDLSRGHGIHARELGNLLVRVGRPAEALRCFQEAIEYTDPTKPRNLSRVHLGLARAFDRLARWTEVDQEIDRVRELIAASGATAYDVELDDFLAETAWHRGHYEIARAGWTELAATFVTMGHPRADRYLDKLKQPRPPR